MEEQETMETKPDEIIEEGGAAVAEPNSEDAVETETEIAEETLIDDAVQADSLTEQELNEMIENICVSKAEEFRMLGYESVTGKEIWDCVSAQYKQLPPLHRIVNDILSLKPTTLMNWMTLSIWKQAEREGGL